MPTIEGCGNNSSVIIIAVIVIIIIILIVCMIYYSFNYYNSTINYDNFNVNICTGNNNGEVCSATNIEGTIVPGTCIDYHVCMTIEGRYLY